MKKIQLVGAAPIEGKMRFPSEGPLEVSNETGDALIGAGLAVADDLDGMKVDDLRNLAEKSGVPVGPSAVKADIVAAIRARRTNKG